jgi:threonyl-tRNA synthetase
MTREVYEAFGFDRIEVTLQTRPEKFLGTIERWDAAEAALKRALEQSGFAVTMLPGEGAFYGPKIGFDFRDVLERSWTLATVQIDCAMPERFGLTYVTPDGSRGDALHDPSRGARARSSASSPSCSSTRRDGCRSGSRRCRCASCR